jgi:tryptophanyl-tRNA synthetase
MKQRILSGIKPTGRPHLGNYFGAMRQFVDMAGEFETFVMVANYHALTTVHNKDVLVSDTKDLILDYLALGLRDKGAAIFLQSDIPEHTEMAWVFECLTTVPYLMRAHAFKDAEGKGKEVSAGLFNYPLLMAADILLYQPDKVPVGKDQAQHIEYARDTAEKFNRIFGEAFRVPEAHIQSEGSTVPGLDGKKMSKSYNNTIPLFATDEEIDRAVALIVTDSKKPDEPKSTQGDTLYALHSLVSPHDLPMITKAYEEGGMGYKDLKALLAQNIKTMVAPLRERRAALAEDPHIIEETLAHGRDTVRPIAQETMRKARELIGVVW